jgi:predicted RNA-binding protein YlxR (DUF448 family)
MYRPTVMKILKTVQSLVLTHGQIDRQTGRGGWLHISVLCLRKVRPICRSRFSHILRISEYREFLCTQLHSQSVACGYAVDARCLQLECIFSE